MKKFNIEDVLKVTVEIISKKYPKRERRRKEDVAEKKNKEERENLKRRGDGKEEKGKRSKRRKMSGSQIDKDIFDGNLRDTL